MSKTNISKQNVDCEYSAVGEVPKELGFGVRHVQALLMFICLTVGYGMRVIMSVAIVAMTDWKNPQGPDIPVFHWSKKIQDLILSSFFWGYLVMQIPGGHIAHRYGAKHLLCFAMAANGIMSILTPFAAMLAGWQAVCACRAIQGLAQGSILPCLHTLQGKWCPLNERGRLSTYIYGGSNCGTILAMTISGFLAASKLGWPSIFYGSGTLSFLVATMWYAFGAEGPSEHRSISDEERDYIQVSLGQQDKGKPMRVPWYQILTHLPVWAIAITHMGSSWVTLTLFTEMPSYLNKVMGVNIKSNGVLSALPFLGMWISSFIFSITSDYLINRGYFSLNFSRKFANTIALWGASAGMLMLSFVPSNNMHLAVTLLVITVSLKAAMYVGFHVNHIDISPNFAGTLMGIGNCFSNTFGTMAPITAGLILQDDTDPTQWRMVFCVSAGITFVTNLFYIIFGSTEKAPWNEPDFFENQNEKQISTKETLILKEGANSRKEEE